MNVSLVCFVTSYDPGDDPRKVRKITHASWGWDIKLGILHCQVLFFPEGIYGHMVG